MGEHMNDENRQDPEISGSEIDIEPSPSSDLSAPMTAAASDSYPVAELFERYGLSRSAVYSIRMKALEIKPFKKQGRAYITLAELQDLDRLHEHMERGGLLTTFEKVQETSQVQEIAQPQPPARFLIASEPPSQEVFELAEELRRKQAAKKSLSEALLPDPLLLEPQSPESLLPEPEDPIQEHKGASPRIGAVRAFFNTDVSELLVPLMQSGRQLLLPITDRLDAVINAMSKLGKDGMDKLEQAIRIFNTAVQDDIVLSSSRVMELLKLKTLPSGKSFERMGFIFTKDTKQGRENGWRVTKRPRPNPAEPTENSFT